MLPMRWISAGHDLRLYKSLSRNSTFEILARVAFLSFAGISSGLAFEDAVYFALTVAYLVLQALFLILLHLGPDVASRGHALAVYGVGFCVLSTVMGAAVYTWAVHPGLGSLLALMLVFATMMSSIGTRIREPVAPLIERVTISASVLVLIAIVVTGDGRSDMEIGMEVTALLGGLVYYLIAFRSVRQAYMKLNRQQEKALQSARMQAIGQITGGVAHDFNNLLAVIRGNLELRKELLSSGASPDEAEALLAEVEKATDRAADTTRDLLSYTRRMPLKPAHVDIGDRISAMLPMLRRVVPAAMTLNYDADDGLPQVMIDAGELENVILNLVLNARDALSGADGVIDISVRHDTGQQVLVTVQDNGAGMSSETLAHATEPYFTTKPPGQASGLGLAMAQGFAAQSGGTLDISSEKGQGTVVTLTVPASGVAPSGR